MNKRLHFWELRHCPPLSGVRFILVLCPGECLVEWILGEEDLLVERILVEKCLKIKIRRAKGSLAKNFFRKSFL